MIFEKSQKPSGKFEKWAGYVFAYFVLSFIIFYTLKWLNKAPSEWNLFIAMEVVLFLCLMGVFIKQILK